MFVDWRAMQQHAERLLDRIGLRVTPGSKSASCGRMRARMVAIAKAIGSEAS